MLATLEEELDIAKAQQEDDTLQHVFKWLTEKRRPGKEEIRKLSREVRDYWNLFDVLYLDKGVIWRKAAAGEFFKTPRICLPEALQPEVIKRIHEQDTVHRKIKKTKTTLLQRFYFPGVHRQVELLVASCAICKRTSGRQLPQHHTYATVQEGYPWRKICIAEVPQ